MALGKGYLEGGAAQSPIFRGLAWAAASAAVGHGTCAGLHLYGTGFRPAPLIGNGAPGSARLAGP